MEVQTKENFLTITPAASEKILAAIDSQEVEDLFLRIYVQGGCSGVQYGMAIDSRFQEGDKTYTVDGMDVVVDRISTKYIEGVTVDFDSTGNKPGFRITNPNPEILAAAGGGCCGGSTSGGCGGGSCSTDGSSGGGCC